MNKFIGCGRLTRDPEVRTTTDGKQTIARYTLAINRRFKKDETDFINCICFNNAANFAEKYLRKGTKIIVCGEVRTGSYTNKEGQKVYTTDVIIEEQEFAESKKSEPTQTAPDDEFVPIPDNITDSLPFK